MFRALVAGTACLLALLLPSQALAAEWAQYGFSAGHGHHNPFETKLGVGNVARLTPACSAAPTWGAPAISGGRLYAAGPRTLQAFDSRTCAVLWSTAIDIDGPASRLWTPAISNGTVVVTGGGRLQAFDAGTGRLEWSALTSADGPPTVAGGRVFVTGADHGIYAVDAATGTLLWRRSSFSDIGNVVAVANGRLFVGGAANGTVRAFRASTGVQLWTARTRSAESPQNWIRTGPAVAGGLVCAGDFEGRLWAFDAATGATRWTTAPGVAYEPPALADGRAYTSAGNRLHALDAATGAPIWSAAGFFGGAAVAVANGVVYANRLGTVVAHHASSGAALWTGPSGHREGTPTVVDGRVYLGTSDEQTRVYAIAAA